MNDFTSTFVTLFFTAMLSGWPMIMDAAVAASSQWTYVFFYIYRITITWIYLPIFAGFVVNALVTNFTAFDKYKMEEIKERASKKRFLFSALQPEKAHMSVNRKSLSINENRNENVSKRSLTWGSSLDNPVKTTKSINSYLSEGQIYDKSQKLRSRASSAERALSSSESKSMIYPGTGKIVSNLMVLAKRFQRGHVYMKDDVTIKQVDDEHIWKLQALRELQDLITDTNLVQEQMRAEVDLLQGRIKALSKN